MFCFVFCLCDLIVSINHTRIHTHIRAHSYTRADTHLLYFSIFLHHLQFCYQYSEYQIIQHKMQITLRCFLNRNCLALRQTQDFAAVRYSLGSDSSPLDLPLCSGQTTLTPGGQYAQIQNNLRHAICGSFLHCFSDQTDHMRMADCLTMFVEFIQKSMTSRRV